MGNYSAYLYSGLGMRISRIRFSKKKRKEKNAYTENGRDILGGLPEDLSDQCQYLGNYPPTPPLTQL